MYSPQPTPYPIAGVTAPDHITRPLLPASNTGWAAAALVFFWPLAFAAFNHAARVYPLWSMGDHAGAQYASAQAKRLGKIALFVWVVLIVLMVVFYIVVIALAISSTTYNTH